jgi:hypothetical protein
LSCRFANLYCMYATMTSIKVKMASSQSDILKSFVTGAARVTCIIGASVLHHEAWPLNAGFWYTSSVAEKSWLAKISEFIGDAGGWGVASQLTAVVMFVFSIYEHAHDQPIPTYTLLVVSVVLLWLGAFIAWNNKRRALEEEIDNRGRPLLTAEFLDFDNPPKTHLMLNNSSDHPAVNVSIKDIRWGGKVLQFAVSKPVRSGPATWVDSWILENGRHDEGNVAAFFSGMEIVGDHSPRFDLRITYSNQDSRASVKNWVLSSAFYFNKLTGKVCMDSSQHIESLK